MGWFRGSQTIQNDSENTIDEQPENENVIETINEEQEPTTFVEESDPSVIENTNNLFSKDTQDKVALDIIVSLENVLKDRQLLSYKNKGLTEQINVANDTIQRYKHDQIKKDQLLQEKSKEIRELENNLTNKQMSYDQLLEDYKEFQLNSNMEYDKISTQLETEIIKYNKLYEESTKSQYQSMLKINELEETIRNLEIENEKYKDQYQKIVDDKEELMKTINDFTERMSFSFSTKSSSSNS